MIPRIIIVGGPNVRLLEMAMAIEALRLEAQVVVVEEQSPPADVMTELTVNCSNVVAGLSDFKRMCAPAVPEYLFESGSLDGIRELRDWFQNKVCQVRNLFVQSRRQHRLPIFQPCWSSRRWRSVT